MSYFILKSKVSKIKGRLQSRVKTILKKKTIVHSFQNKLLEIVQRVKSLKKIDSYQITCKNSLILNTKSFYSSFYLGPFISGQSLTIANALRRTLLSELYGIGIVAIEIEGVTHEYSNIQGVKETVLDILLNIKEIVLKTNSYIKNISSIITDIGVFDHIGFLQAKGPGIIRAKHIKLPPYLLFVDSEQYIATLTENAVLNIKFYFAFGQNFKTSSKLGKTKLIERKTITQFLKTKFYKIKNTHKKILLHSTNKKLKNKRIYSNKVEPVNHFKTLKKKNKNLLTINSSEPMVKKSEISVIKLSNFVDQNLDQQIKTSLKNYESFLLRQNKFKKSFYIDIDPIFMPVTKVNYIIEENPVDFSSQIIFLEIWTNGSLHPRKALQQALKKLVTIFFSFWKFPREQL